MLMAFLRGVLPVVIGIYLIALLVAVFFSEQLIFQPQQAGFGRYVADIFAPAELVSFRIAALSRYPACCG